MPSLWHVAQLGDAVLAAKALQHDADIVLDLEVPPHRAPDTPPLHKVEPGCLQDEIGLRQIADIL